MRQLPKLLKAPPAQRLWHPVPGKCGWILEPLNNLLRSLPDELLGSTVVPASWIHAFRQQGHHSSSGSPEHAPGPGSPSYSRREETSHMACK
eukprot:CAMPEP_0181533182 /NCGR_PEP_ID=MMETSP1110-20121109/73018_1 /TAXON_ID=174948 /ORGANISM="Symbiodinium sp., Strain CCMP421" /LENGTH=91 /DNA_ID=CAMNT_0023664343 /DNA_START=78 /DNA_END=350 /DNA_ORIENTATION=-